jgi:hypothetical protein
MIPTAQLSSSLRDTSIQRHRKTRPLFLQNSKPNSRIITYHISVLLQSSTLEHYYKAQLWSILQSSTLELITRVVAELNFGAYYCSAVPHW